MFKRDGNTFCIRLIMILCIILMAHPAHSNGDMVAKIIQGLKSKDPVQREFYASAVMALRPDSREVVSHLITALKDENENVRKFSAMSLGYIQDTAAVGPLILALKDKSPEVRWRSAKTLGKMKSKDAFYHLKLLAKGDEEKAVRAVAVQALMTVNNLESVEIIADILKNQPLKSVIISK